MTIFPTFTEIPLGISDITPRFVFRDDGRVSFPFQASIVKKIESGLGDNPSMIRRHNTEFRTERGSLGFIIECTDEMIKWAKSIDPEVEIKKLAGYDMEYEDYNHLAALAIIGDFERLNYLLEKRRKDPGNDPYVPGTLHPMIKPENIARAIEVAEHYKRHPVDWRAFVRV